VRVTAALIEPATDRRLWSDRYERNLTSVLALQPTSPCRGTGRQGRAVARGGAAAVRMTREVNPEVYELYLKGSYYLNSRRRMPW